MRWHWARLAEETGQLARRPFSVLFLTCASISLLEGTNFGLSACLEGTLLMGAIFLLCTCALLTLALAKRCSMSSTLEMGMAISALAFVAAIWESSLLWVEDRSYRTRSHATHVVAWKVAPMLCGFPFVLAVGFLLVDLCVDIAVWELCRFYYKDWGTWMVHLLSVFVTIGMIAMSWASADRFRATSHAQECFLREKVLVESVVTMMSDTVMHLAEDGGTILHASSGPKGILGPEVIGDDISDYLAEEEMQQVKDCLENVGTSPVMLTLSAIIDENTKVPVEMVIVGNRNSGSIGNNAGKEAGPQHSYLIGIRRARQSSAAASELMELRRQAEDEALSLAQAQEDTQASVGTVQTTATGRAFDRADTDRTYKGPPEEQNAELRRALDEIFAVARREHWLVESKDIKLCRDHILGAGSFGCVVAGWCHGLPIAAKFPRAPTESNSANHLASVVNEVQFLRRLRHPNIVLFYGAHIDPARSKVVMLLELIKGPDLQVWVKDHPVDSYAWKRLQLLLDVSCALQYLHAKKPPIIHCDLKDTNILVDAAVPRAKLADFGFARLRTRGAQSLGGSLSWMAPERIVEPFARPMTAGDVFSFGRVAYLVITTRTPLEGMSRKKIIQAAKKGIAHKLDWNERKPLQRECRKLCKVILSLVPENRPSMATVHQEMAEWLSPVVAQTGSGGAPAEGQQEDGTEEQAPLVPLVLPKFGPTTEAVKRDALEESVMMWNYPHYPGSCCSYHSAVEELARVVNVMKQDSCQPAFKPYESFQCMNCGVLDMFEEKECPQCMKTVSSRTGGCLVIKQSPPAPATAATASRAQEAAEPRAVEFTESPCGSPHSASNTRCTL